jgi:hypothetical protein
MSLLPLTLLLLAADPAPAIKLAAPGFQYVNMDEKVGDFFTDYLAQQLGNHGVRVTTKNEVMQLLGFERQKSLLGCPENQVTCMAELAGGLGVDGLLLGNVAKIGSGFAIAIRVVDPATAKPLSSFSGRVSSDDEMLRWLQDTAKAMAGQLLGRVQAEWYRTMRPVWWMPTAAGGALAIGGAVFYGLARGEADKLVNRSSQLVTAADAQQAAATGRTFQTTSFIMLGVGVAAAAVGGAFYLLGTDGKPQKPKLSVAPSAGGLGVTFEAVWP